MGGEFFFELFYVATMIKIAFVFFEDINMGLSKCILQGISFILKLL